MILYKANVSECLFKWYLAYKGTDSLLFFGAQSSKNSLPVRTVWSLNTRFFAVLCGMTHRVVGWPVETIHLHLNSYILAGHTVVKIRNNKTWELLNLFLLYQSMCLLDMMTLSNTPVGQKWTPSLGALRCLKYSNQVWLASPSSSISVYVTMVMLSDNFMAILL